MLLEMGIASIQNTSSGANDSQMEKVFTIAPKDLNYTALHLRIRPRISVRTSMTEFASKVTSRDIFQRNDRTHLHISLTGHSGLHVYEVKIGVHCN